MKEGYKTTEFWLSLLSVLLAAIVPLVASMPMVAQVVGLILAVLTALGYTASRTSVKNNQG